MTIYSNLSNDVARKAAIVEVLTRAASEEGTQIHAIGGIFRSPLSLFEIKTALAYRTEEVHRLLSELVSAGTVTLVTGGSENAQKWKYQIT